MKRRQLGDNASTYRQIARDYERQAKTKEALEVYAMAPRYRSTGIVKKDAKGRIKRYKNLAVFHRECPTRSSYPKLICELKSVRRLTDGSGMASVEIIDPVPSTIRPSRRGTWRLHFASYDVMLDKLKRRVNR